MGTQERAKKIAFFLTTSFHAGNRIIWKKNNVTIQPYSEIVIASRRFCSFPKDTGTGVAAWQSLLPVRRLPRSLESAHSQ